MSSEERILRLENAMATLAELSANQEQRTARLEESFLRLEESNRRLEESNRRLEESNRRLEEGFEVLKRLAAEQQKMLANLNRRTGGLEEAFKALFEMSQSHHDSLDELRAVQVESERKATDSEAEWKRWAAEAERRVASLAASQAHSDRRLDALIDIVRKQRGGESRNEAG
jgi:membrane protein involved in colicin uptake